MNIKLSILLLSLTIATTLLSANGNNTIKSFSTAKKILKKQIYNNDKLEIAFYSGCRFDWKLHTYKSGKQRWKQVVDKNSCGYIPRTKSRRANFIEYEHIVPAHAFGHFLPCWKSGGRKNCTKTSKKFKMMEADLYNLVPAIGELNADRSNFTFTELYGEPRAYGDVDFEVDFKARKVEPSEIAKGQIARVYFYFQDKYNLPISKKQMKLFKAWDKMYPPTEFEIYILNKKKKFQKNDFN